jgi:hypothetical protein
MAEVLDQIQICERFPSEWVLIDSPQTDELLAVKGGVVLFHSKDRDEVYNKAAELRPRRFAVLFTGPMPEHIAINL